MANDKVIIITKDNFEDEVIKSDIPVLVDFWASWCGPCRAIAPIIDELANDFYGKAKIAKVNVDEQGELAAKFRIMSIPTIMLFKDGQSVEKVVGAKTKEDFAALINKNL